MKTLAMEDPIWIIISETGVTRKAWRVPVTSTTRTRDAKKIRILGWGSGGCNNAFLICSEKCST